MAYPKINKNSAGCTRGIIVPLTQQHINCKFLNPKGIGKIPIHSMAHCIIAKEFISADSLKYLIPHLKSIIVVGEINANDLYKTFFKFSSLSLTEGRLYF